jgi:hypothetical protein
MGADGREPDHAYENGGGSRRDRKPNALSKRRHASE